MDCQKTCVLSVQIHCSVCKRKVQKVLEKVNGVCSIGIDEEHGRVRVSGAAEADQLIEALKKAGKRAEVLWESNPNTSYQNPNVKASEARTSDGTRLHVSDQMPQSQQNSGIDRAKTVEINNPKCVKVKFKGSIDGISHKNDGQSTKICINESQSNERPTGAAQRMNTQYTYHGYAGPRAAAGGARSEIGNGCRCGGIPPAPPPTCNHYGSGSGGNIPPPPSCNHYGSGSGGTIPPPPPLSCNHYGSGSGGIIPQPPLPSCNHYAYAAGPPPDPHGPAVNVPYASMIYEDEFGRGCKIN